MDADTGDSGGDVKVGTGAATSGVTNSDLMATPSSGMIVENLNPVLLAVLGVGKNSSLDGLILVFNEGGGARRLPLGGPGEEAVLLASGVVSAARFIRRGRGDTVRLRSKGDPVLFSWPAADLFDARRSRAAMPFAIGDDGLGGASEGNRACNSSRMLLCKAGFCGISDIVVARKDMQPKTV